MNELETPRYKNKERLVWHLSETICELSERIAFSSFRAQRSEDEESDGNADEELVDRFVFGGGGEEKPNDGAKGKLEAGGDESMGKELGMAMAIEMGDAVDAQATAMEMPTDENVDGTHGAEADDRVFYTFCPDIEDATAHFGHCNRAVMRVSSDDVTADLMPFEKRVVATGLGAAAAARR